MSDDDSERRTERPARLGEFLDGDAPLPDLSEAEWAARDALVGAEREAREAIEERKRQEALRVDLAERGAPVKDLERALGDNLEETPALAAVRRALAERLILTTIAGPRGVGKTTAATWWLIQPHPAARWVRTLAPRFIDAPTLARWPRYEDEPMRQLERAGALVIDDLGAEYDDKQGAFRSLVDALINARYAACLPTLITTNLPADDGERNGERIAGFKSRYGERVADRIREAGRFVAIQGASMRGRR